MLIFFTCCVAQQYPFVHYTPRDGLVNSRVRKAYQDSRGRMYFLTFGGLSMYDGARFRNYTSQNGLPVDLVNDVLEIGNDSLLVATNTCGLRVLVHSEIKNLPLTGNNCPVVNHFLKSREGIVYATADDGLYQLKQHSFEKLSTRLPGKKEDAIYLGEVAEYKDFLVFTTNDLRYYTGLYLYSKKDNAITDYLPKALIYSLKSDHSGKLWISVNKEILNLDTTALQTGKLVFVKPYYLAAAAGTFHPGNIVFNGQNELHIASSGKGIVRYRKDGTILHIGSPEIADLVLQNFFIDREDVLWVCHDGNGVYKLSNTKLQSSPAIFGENKSGVRCVRSNSPDTCWVVMNNGEVILQALFRTKSFSVAPSFNANTLYYNSRNLYAADYNNLYMAALPAGDETTIRFKKILELPDTASFGASYVNDPSGNIILFEGRNICVFRQEKLLHTYPVNSYDLIEGMYMDRNKQLWVVSRSNGLQVFSLHPENPSNYLQKKAGFTKEFENASPRCMTVDKNEILWTGTRYNGLMGFDYKNNRLRKIFHFQTQDGLTDNFVTSLATDDDNNIIIGMQTGLDRLIKTNGDSYRLENLTKSNNIFSYISTVWTDLNKNAFALSNSGILFRMEASRNGPSHYEPKLLIEEIKINGKRSSLFPSPLRLKYQQRNITFSVAAPAFLDEKQIKYSYLLTGAGPEEWSDTSNVADINLLNLSPGSYTLQVKAFFPSTAYSPAATTFAFVIVPPWWQRWWFRVGIGLLGVGMLIAGIRFYYRRKLEKQKTVLERQQAIEKERTRIATDMHDDLGAGLSRIKFLSETIGIKKQQRQPIEEDITKIREYSHEMIDKMGEIVWALNEKNDSLSDLLSYTRSYAADYLTQNGISCKINMPENIPDLFVSGEFRRNIYLTIKEALHNIIKHAQADHIVITVNTGQHLTIRIKDDGMGFDKKNIRPFSNGISNMQKRMSEIKGVFNITGDDGTEVVLSAPLT